MTTRLTQQLEDPLHVPQTLYSQLLHWLLAARGHFINGIISPLYSSTFHENYKEDFFRENPTDLMLLFALKSHKTF